MRIQLTALLTFAAVLVAVSYQGSPATGAPPRDAPDLSTFQTVVAPLFRARCVRCHGPREHKEGLRLDKIDPALALGRERPRWTEIRDRLKDGEMPPKGEPRPSSADVTRVLAWIDGERAKADRAGPAAPGRVVLRRLNRAEYANTLRDLLHVEFPFGGGPLDLLPPDGTAAGFDKVGSALMVDAALVDQYLAVARRVADAAIVTGPRPVDPPQSLRIRGHGQVSRHRLRVPPAERHLPSDRSRAHGGGRPDLGSPTPRPEPGDRHRRRRRVHDPRANERRPRRPRRAAEGPAGMAIR